MRDRRIRGAFVALIFALPALIVLATAPTASSILEWLAVEVVVACGQLIALMAKAAAQCPQAVVPVRIRSVVPRRPKRSVRTIA